MEKYLCTQYPTFHTGKWGPGKASFYANCGLFFTYPDKFIGRKVWIATNEVPSAAGVFCKNCESKKR